MENAPAPAPRPEGGPALELPALTGARFVAALYVLIFHIWATLGLRTWRPLHNVLWSGSTAVTFFFVLSGFILAVKYAPGLSLEPGHLRRFYRARFFRVYPCYLAALLLTVVAVVGLGFRPQEPPSLDAALASALGVQAWHPRWARSWNTPGWSVSVEVACYLAFPWLLDRARRLPGRARLWLLGASWASGLLVLLPAIVAPSLDTPVWQNVAKFSPLARGTDFVAGVALGLLFLDDRAAGRQRSGGALVAAGLLASLPPLALADAIPKPLVHNGLLVPPIALVILGLAHGGGPIGRLLSTRPLVALGEASYALYIFQLPLGACYIALLTGHVPVMAGAALYVPFLLIASLALHAGFEAPLRAWGMRGAKPLPGRCAQLETQRG